MSKEKRQVIEFRVPSWSLCALINNDYSGLNSEDEAKLKEFVNKTIQVFGNANFQTLPEEVNESGFYHSNDIDNLGAMCETVCIICEKRQ